MTITSKNQVTLPQSLLQLLQVSQGDKIMAKVDQGKVIVEPVGGGILDLAGRMPPLKLPKGKTVDQLIAEARDAHLTPLLH